MANDIGVVDYNDSNRAFLQAFMAHSSMTFEEAKPILAAIFSAHETEHVSPIDITEEDFSSYIAAANTAVSPFDLEIRSTLRQIQTDGDDTIVRPERVYALVNTTSDPLTQLATTYTADEIAFVKRLLDAMFETHNTMISEAMVVSGMQAMQLARVSSADAGAGGSRRESMGTQGGAVQSLTMSQAETVMQQLVDEGWMEKSRKGFYGLSPRGLMELRGWLVATYNDEMDDGRRADKVKFCAACRDIITVGQRCANRDCAGRLHDICIRNFFRMQQAEKCPVCKAAWPGDKFVGERAVTSTDRYLQGKRRSTNTQRQSGVGASQVTAGGGDEESSEEDVG
ncbi:non-structural maintenance of chromosomes element 1 family protein [Aspergillus glaucus CBS 516.65]|uniref:Non-structural maintenance of chromosomes element 1 homolog n=1 Tax=Aspergillus glaucus CBS 516.65 TaxID=1160497 RepID=A0A1L9V7D6_ASPGL|nr:hypothetical protein ASPGLDRAFT_52367 [Aspergillus glaucus CBS 516.65]OJJ79826.1 hypothetical protein ASPGLDRAFT_52367 [Aspergillus glaucus CBS 516.65]